MRKYYTLVSKSSEVYHNNDWCIEFGDYERATVKDEMDMQKDDAERNQQNIKFKIIITGDNQVDIKAAVDELNK